MLTSSADPSLLYDAAGRDASPETGRFGTVDGRLMLVALGALGVHLCLSVGWPQVEWITCAGWIAMYAVALAVTIREYRTNLSDTRWRWGLLGINFTLSICSFCCILYGEYVVRSSPGAAWLNDLLRAYRGLALLLVVCTPEETERKLNRVLDGMQAALIGIVFLLTLSPDLLFRWNTHRLLPDPGVMNRYSYSQSIITVFLAVLAVFTARTAGSRFFHRVLALYLCIGVPVGIWTNQVLVNGARVPPASALYVLGDLCLLAYVIAVPLWRGRVGATEPSQSLLFLRLGAASFLPLLAMLVSMLLAVGGHHPAIGIATALLSLMLFGVRSTFGQMRQLTLQRSLQLANEQLETLSQHDPLTGLYNRRWFSERFAEEWKRHQRSREPLSILLLDIDQFKRYNDMLGHSEGDACLQAVSKALGGSLQRATDALVRYGGEEFVVLLPNTDDADLMRVAEKMRTSLASLRLVHPGSPAGIVTVSVGGATWYGGDVAKGREQLIIAADEALYAAKNQGRDCVRLVRLG